MSSKQSLQSKKEALLNLNRTVMLTRFKLSQQKRQLREKDRRMSHITQLIKKPQTSSTDDRTNTATSPKQHKSYYNLSKKIKLAQSKGLEKEEFYPNRVKRNTVSKKIVLKPKQELKVIGRSNEVHKRKLNIPQKGVKTPPTKKLKTSNKFSATHPSNASDRSQSPIYSELSFEEVIRIADENDNLDDEDLLEILTCPSPVWWEDPPNDAYLEDPITETPKTTSSLPVKQCKIKSSRKKKPHKIVSELPKTKESEVSEKIFNVDSLVESVAFKNIGNSDVKFKNKRSKLESLLSTIKNKINDPKSSQDKKLQETSVQENCVGNMEHSKVHGISSCDDVHKKVSESSDDGLFTDMSLRDSDILKQLENIEIPVEGKKDNNSKTNADVKFSNDSNKLPIKPTKHLTIYRKDISKTMPTFVKTRKLKILNIKKAPPNLLQNKDKCVKNFTITSFVKTNNIPETLKPNTKIISQKNLDSKLKYLKNIKSSKEIDTTVNRSTGDKKTTTESEISIDLTNVDDDDDDYAQKEINEIIPQDETEEYVTVFKILSNITDALTDDECENLNNDRDEIDKSKTFKLQTEEVNNSQIKQNENPSKDENGTDFSEEKEPEKPNSSSNEINSSITFNTPQTEETNNAQNVENKSTDKANEEVEKHGNDKNGINSDNTFKSISEMEETNALFEDIESTDKDENDSDILNHETPEKPNNIDNEVSENISSSPQEEEVNALFVDIEGTDKNDTDNLNHEAPEESNNDNNEINRDTLEYMPQIEETNNLFIDNESTYAGINCTDIFNDLETENHSNGSNEINSSIAFTYIPQTDSLTIDKEMIDKDRNKINSYYKNCKNAKRGLKKIEKSIKDDKDKTKTDAIIDNEEMQTEDDEKKICDDCNKDSIIVSETKDIKYCMKCSSIFDLEQCNYCIRKETQKHQNQPDNSNSSVKVNKEYVKDDV